LELGLEIPVKMLQLLRIGIYVSIFLGTSVLQCIFQLWYGLGWISGCSCCNQFGNFPQFWWDKWRISNWVISRSTWLSLFYGEISDNIL